MATKYATQQQGVVDGTAVPADKHDARQVNAKKTAIVASKEAGVSWANGDKIYLGFKPAGCKIVDIKANSDTSFGTSTLKIGIGEDPLSGDTISDDNKYVDGKTMTAVNTPTSIGPLASTVDDSPPDGEHLWLTPGVADIGAAVIASIVVEMVGIN